MQLPRQPVTETMKRISDLLICAPSNPAEIHKKTGLHRNTINAALKFLVQNELVSKERNGQRVLYSLALANEDWYVPWIKLLRPKEKLSTPKEIGRKMSKGLLRKEVDRQVSNLRERFGKLAEAPLNDELIDELIKLHKDVPQRLLLDNIEKPFCLECLNSTKLFFPMFLIQDSNEFCCPNCGISIPRLSTETNRPTEKPEETKGLELFYSGKEKKKESYMEIERLLTKYKQGSARKRRNIKKR
jgi:DNA-binding transcriptional ArsR family regulator